MTAWQFHWFLTPATQRALRQYSRYLRVFETQYYGVLRCFVEGEAKVDLKGLRRLEFSKPCKFTDPDVPEGFPRPCPDDNDNDENGSIGSRVNQGSNWTTELRARNVLGLVDEDLLLSVMAKAPRLSVFVMYGFPFDNDQLIRMIADRLFSGTGTRSDNIDNDNKSIFMNTSSSGSGNPRSGIKISSEFRKLELVNRHYTRARVRSIEYLLSRCPPELEELLLSISFGSRAELDSEGDFQDDPAVSEQQEEQIQSNGDGTLVEREGTVLDPASNSGDGPGCNNYLDECNRRTWNLKKLTIGGDLGGPGGLIWLPLLRRCHRLESLSAHLFTDDSLPQLSTVLRSSCPELNELALQCMTGGSQDDQQIALLIQSSQAWKHISLSFFHGLGSLSTAALVHQHSTTLESLVLKECDGFCSEDIQAVLSSCVNLRVFQALTSSGTEFSSTVYLDAREMVDSPWVCLRLESLMLVITGIARPDLKVDQYGRPLTGPLHDGSIRDYEMQQIVYSQLGKLTQLRELWLGHDIPDLDDEENYHPTEIDGQWKYIDPDEQFECLEFSLRSGLDLLGGLTELRVLNVDRMNIRVGLLEVQWMAERWPKMERIVGLVEGQGGVSAPKHIQWLYDHRPWIELPRRLGNFTFASSSRLVRSDVV
ncbi:hypothetical protein BGZ95_000094 [Linnemannia exigua]|uniref:Uncharacterized protein n=1 Tax=Linnemannia exigua TaxID=604196 RepID=A0AAD4D8R7_9FUNG|nr:hypothetical protein BGZ95_000094 [Linnemannia exigua]